MICCIFDQVLCGSDQYKMMALSTSSHVSGHHFACITAPSKQKRLFVMIQMNFHKLQESRPGGRRYHGLYDAQAGSIFFSVFIHAKNRVVDFARSQEYPCPAQRVCCHHSALFPLSRSCQSCLASCCPRGNRPWWKHVDAV